MLTIRASSNQLQLHRPQLRRTPRWTYAVYQLAYRIGPLTINKYLTPSKTEFMVVCTARNRSKISICQLEVGDSAIKSTKSREKC